MVRTSSCVLAALVICLPVAIAVTPAAATPRAPTVPMITHPQDDWAGAGIAAHEGGARPQSAVPATAVSGVPGMDVSGHQSAVNWATSAHAGSKFAYVKATESNNYVNPDFGQQYNGSYKAGMIRGAYHFATPNTASATAQATWFLGHGGGWTADGHTLPPAVDLEYNPYGQTCYGMSPATLVAWVRQFVNVVKAKIGRYPAIYTSTSWWSQCMGNNAGFGADPLWIARYNSVVGTLPPGWRARAIWQYADSGKFPGDQDAYNGTLAQLQALAKG